MSSLHDLIWALTCGVKPDIMVKCVIDMAFHYTYPNVSHFPSPKCEMGTHAEVPVPAGGNNILNNISIYTLYIILFLSVTIY